MNRPKSEWDRRTVLQYAAAALLLPALPGRGARAGRFAPPAGRCSTPGGSSASCRRARSSVSRSFAVRFVREAGGFRVEGEQVASKSRPRAARAFARLERERVETGLFPLALDADGAIPRCRARPRARGSTRRCARRGRDRAWPARPAERDELRAFVNAVHQSAGEL
jgi:hypothetical protein